MDEPKSVQEIHAPNSICFGCGPANEEGLRIRSFTRNDIENGLKMTFNTEEHHQAFPGMVNGGIIGTLLDCHGNWTAAIAIMTLHGDSEPPCTVTANYSVQLRRPTPHGTELTVTSEVIDLQEDRASIRMEMHAEDVLCARGEGLFVAVKEGHPAYHRWN
ncbi:MAG TPA: PaaI family thioesterase [Candidatus Thalassarchaeaceae archaeon]|jgi:acyl-coenzyme A thioesterase PaaI-like protein|nr:PaaI family thioesterase [Candidatus Thalassarchaeaceae archaeon]